MRNRKLDVIGSIVPADFPELGTFRIPAKIDTGAGISALHCNDIYEIVKKKKRWLCFNISDTRRHFQTRKFYFRKFERIRIKNSSGNIEKRYKIKTLIKISGRNIRASFTLTDRSSMTYPILIGCSILRNRFLVDVSLKTHAARKT